MTHIGWVEMTRDMSSTLNDSDHLCSCIIHMYHLYWCTYTCDMYQLESQQIISTDTDASFEQINADHTHRQTEIVRLCT